LVGGLDNKVDEVSGLDCSSLLALFYNYISFRISLTDFLNMLS
jgi:hypothetical protein